MNKQSSLAMATKAKAMYGKHLTKSDYDELLRRKSVPEIAAYLKHETPYRKSLEGINEYAVHRGHLEMLVRKTFYVNFVELIRYGQSGKDHFYEYGILMIEIRQILVAVRALSENDRHHQIAQLPLFAQRFVSFDIEELVKADSYDQLLKVLKHSPYYEVLMEHRPFRKDDIDYNAIEISLKNLYYRRVYEIINKEFSGKDREAILENIEIDIELENITKIYRLKKYYHASPEQIKKVLSPTYKRISKEKLYQWIEETNADGFLKAVHDQAYRFPLEVDEFQYIEYQTNAIRFEMNKRLLRYSSNPNIILVAYLSLLEIEINNIIEIIEGVRYKVDGDKIQKLLIY